MTHYIISSQREGRFFVKQMPESRPTVVKKTWDYEFSKAPEYLVEGSVTGKIGDEVDGYLEYYVDVMGRWMLVDSKEQSDEYLGAKRIVFVPRSATYFTDLISNSKLFKKKESGVEPDEFINKHVKMIKEKIAAKKYDFVVDKIKHLQHEPFRASIQYFLDTGSVNGSFYEALQKIMDFYKPTEDEAVKNLLGEEILDDLFDFNNKLARFQDRIPSEIKVQWNDLLSKYAKRKASLQQPTYSREKMIDFAEWLAECTQVVKEEKITLYRYHDAEGWGNYTIDDIVTVFEEKYLNK